MKLATTRSPCRRHSCFTVLGAIHKLHLQEEGGEVGGQKF